MFETSGFSHGLWQGLSNSPGALSQICGYLLWLQWQKQESSDGEGSSARGLRPEMGRVVGKKGLELVWGLELVGVQQQWGGVQ